LINKIETVSLKTLGCRLNQSESDCILDSLIKNGLTHVSDDQNPDLIIINSCAVTKQAEAKTRGAITAAKKKSPMGKLVVVGCYPQESAEKVLAIPEVDLVLGNHEKYKIIDYLPSLEKISHEEKEHCVSNMLDSNVDNYTFPIANICSAGSTTRAFMKVQDGCGYFCSYCIIPYLRGSVRSRNISDCIDETKLLVDKGYKEIVLSGINLGTYKAETGENLAGLLKKMLAETDIKRIRLSSIEPNLISSDLLEIIAHEKRICRQLHIPLQHGSDRILKLMNRKYKSSDYKSLIEKIKNQIPDICIGADVIVGFPGERDDDFFEMLKMLEDLALSYLHVFRYSKRPGTKASQFKENVKNSVKKERSKILRDLSLKKQKKFFDSFVNEKLEVLFEKKDKHGFYIGHSDNYIEVAVKNNKNLINQIIYVKVCKVLEDKVEGELLVE